MNQSNAKRVVCLAVLAVLLIVVVCMLPNTFSLINQVQVELATTPTPAPTMLSVMQVTVDPSLPTEAPVFRSGQEGEAIVELQTRLQALGFYSGELDGQFGPGTKQAVIDFQSQHGLGADGIVGTETRTILYSSQAHTAAPTATPSPVPTATPQPAYQSSIADGTPILVNRDNPIPEDYQPRELVMMRDYCDSSLVKIKGSEIQGEREAVDALMVMLQAAKDSGVTNWQISAGYRTVAYQEKLFNDKVKAYQNEGNSRNTSLAKTRLTVAEPGTSEHHTGLAFDVTVPGVSFKGTDQQVWLHIHCYDYGFIIRYEEDKQSITGFTAEPWHIRYVGVAHAQAIRDAGYCLEEYLDAISGMA